MILAKNRLNAAATPRTTTALRGKIETKARGDSEGGAKHVEISFVLPRQEGAELIKSLKASERSGGSPLLLWVGPEGDVDIVVRERANGARGDAATPLVAARAQCRLPEGTQAARPEMEAIEIRDLYINPGRHEVLVGGKAIPQLTFTEFGILHYLARHAGWVFNRQQIVEGVKGKDYPVTDRAVDVQVAGLRKKLGAAADCVQTVRGVGYRFRD